MYPSLTGEACVIVRFGVTPPELAIGADAVTAVTPPDKAI
jgi:hypothetical protein